MKKLVIFILLLLASITPSVATDAMEPTYPLALPQSPNMYDFPVYGDVPVDYYSGTMNFSIPIYEIEVDGVKVPISLNYASTGIKVSQHASNVGLGWTLQCGGYISLDCYGKNDFDSNGGYFNSIFPNGIPEDTMMSKYSKTNNQTYDITKWDTHPDVYHYTFAGHNGSMMFSRENQTTPILLNPNSYMSFDYVHGGQRWVAYDGNGNRYTFGNKYHKSATGVSFFAVETGGEGISLGHSDDPSFASPDWSYGSVNAWPIDSIVTSRGRRILFSYHLEHLQTPLMSQEEVRLVLPYDNSQNLLGNCIYCVGQFTASSISSEISQAVVDRIQFPRGDIVFYSSPRYDIWEGGFGGRGETSPTKLDSLVIYESSRVIKRVKFYYHYMGSISSPNTCRLMLDSVCGLTPKPYAFTYYTEQLPKKNSRQIDMWGYYNGSLGPEYWGHANDRYIAEGTLIPSMEIAGRFYYGRDRNVKKSLITNAVLRSVSYPTGGKTVFTYEPHRFKTVVADTKNAIDSSYSKITCLNYHVDFHTNPTSLAVSTPATTQTFYLDSLSTLDIHIESSLAQGKLTGTPMIISYLIITNSLNQEIDRRSVYVGAYSQDDNYHFSLNGHPAGEYYVTIVDAELGFCYAEAPQSYYVSSTLLNVCATIKCSKHSQSDGIIEEGAGIRIASIQNFDENGGLIRQQNFTYLDENMESSGVLMVVPQFSGGFVQEFYYHDDYEDNSSGLHKGPHSMCYPAYSHVVSSSMLNDPNPIFCPSMVGYSCVTESIYPSTENGYTSFYFYNQRSASSVGWPGFLSVANMHNGELLKKCVYSSDHFLAEKTEYSCVFRYDFSAKGMNYAQTFPPRWYSAGNQQIPNILWDKYELHSLRKKAERVSTTMFVPDDSITTVVEQELDSLTMLPLYTLSISQSDTLKQTSLYASRDTSSVGQQLRDYNMHNAQISQHVSENNHKVQSFLWQYALQDDKILLKAVGKQRDSICPDTIWTYRAEAFDRYGNPTTIIDATGVPTAYLWGCDYRYPIIQAIGVSYSQICELFNDGMLQMLNSSCDVSWPVLRTVFDYISTAFPSAEVTIRSYLSGVGISHEITSHGIIYSYEYDEYNRLTGIYRYMDDNWEVIEKYEYHYHE